MSENENVDVLDEILDGAEPVEQEDKTEAEEKTTEPETEQQVEAEQPEPAPKQEPEPKEEPEAPKTVPLATFLDMRDKLKEAERQLAGMRQQQSPQAQPPLPDPLSDPLGFAVYQDSMRSTVGEQMQVMHQQQHAFQIQYVNNSLELLADKLGKDEFDAAYSAVQQVTQANPDVYQYVINHHNPGIALMEVYRNIQINQRLGQIPAGMSIDDWIRAEAAKLAPQPPAAPQPTEPQTKAPPPSLAGAKGGGAPSTVPPLSDDPLDDLLA